MDIFELSERDKEISDGLHVLVDDMYAAIDEKAPAETREDLIVKAKEKLALYDKLMADLHGAQLDETERQYKRQLTDLRKFLVQLEEMR
jgi:hypothetical protein